MGNESFFLQILIWRIKHISNRNFVLILSIIVGFLSGLAAVLLKESVHLIQYALTSHFDYEYSNYLYLAYPLIGILITVLLAKYFFREPFGHGITGILYAISRKSSNISRSKTYSNLLGSAITVGFGGSVGLEAPIVVTGSAIGSNIGRLVHLQAKKRALLIGCGTAGAISAIFNSPIAGVIFSIEVILTDISINAFIPLLISSVTGSLTSLLLLGDEILFSFTLEDPFTAMDTPYYFFLGIFCGLVSLYFTRITYQIENFLSSIRNQYKRAVLGGLALGLIIFIFPPMYGEGYNFIKLMLEGNEQAIFDNSMFFQRFGNVSILLLFILGLILIKPIAAASTIGAGGNGGIFAPSLFIGAVTGFFFAKLVNTMGIFGTVSLSNFTLVGMCGLMSGILHAPLTAIFLIAEITSGYTLFVPLMLVSALSYSTILYFERYSLYLKSLVKKGYLNPDDRDLQVLSLIDIKKLLETDLLTIRPDASLGDLVNLVRVSKRNIFPVVNEQKELVGIVTLDDIRKIMFDHESQESIKVSSLMHAPPDKISTTETMQEVMEKFEKTGAWNLPVLNEGKYMGLISKSRIFNAYRNKLMRQRKEF
ncbi:CIC family chloride channel protein [Catalinimonas alkaloidigena]|uniref:chloride channel protein n=1 Tax=Catalinimonas alkaloidigena TaxID=1075417 RepID=UPI0024053DB9|nr:chloride channel protein [Catalinimonas alkaloidigena]MDF9797235.1 CIC family chloride channel protein [Catalinimonas alkaloidigena]